MKKTRIHRVWILFLLGIMACLQVRAQYMPVVFDKKYGDKNQIQLVCPLAGDEVAMVGKEGQKYNLTWIGREGEVLFSLPLAGFTAVNELTYPACRAICCDEYKRQKRQCDTKRTGGHIGS